MLIKFFNWFFGYVVFTFSGGFTDGFINRCYHEKINIKDISAENGVLTARCSIGAYKRLHKIAFRSGGKVKLVKKRGLPFLLHPLKGRWGVFCGMLFFVLLVSFMGGFIWNITVIGNQTLETSKIVDYLAQNGFKTGVRWSETDKENLEFAVMADFDRVAWISINRIGCLAQVEIRETTPKPEIENNNLITNVTAKKDGVIVKVTALGGWPAVQAGDAVTTGDLLISGVYEPEEYSQPQKNHFARAHGSVIAKTNSRITVNIPREQSEKICTSEKQYKTLYFFGLEIPMSIKKEEENTVCEYQKKYLVFHDFRLPIGIYTEIRRSYTDTKRSISDDELRAAAKKELLEREKEKLAGCEIIGKTEKEEITDGGIVYTAEYSLLEDIGAEQEIIFSDTDKDNS
ncbi:MAG TPA: sporulation protein YqfD [Candidatus Eubacterium faecale]|uniref:Sporulation protein YqfD n=1 Tax=Candidatus Eubacterium faecale TaxID=2838568 RepID=A0A9D2MHS4_9FIRM|nr:sporulation protein YqfD [Candidatus Eubacterium faecale]